MRAVRLVVAAALVAVASTTAAAQDRQGAGERQGQAMTPEQRQARQNESLFKGITLTEVQKAKVDSIQLAARKTNETLMQGARQDPAVRDKMIEARRKSMADIRAVLTPEQQAVYDCNVEAMPQGRVQRPPSER